jgi:hypothetical protein
MPNSRKLIFFHFKVILLLYPYLTIRRIVRICGLKIMGMVCFCFFTKPFIFQTYLYVFTSMHNYIFLGNYSVYGMEIKLSRCVSPYLLNVYLPTAIFVVMSWVRYEKSNTISALRDFIFDFSKIF